jgi:uncharacterized protein
MLLSAFLLGLASSLHCAAMCGPLTLALPLSPTERWRAVGGLLTYHMGRAFTYGLMGLALGLLGYGLAVAGWQRTLSVVMGAALIVGAFWSASPFLGRFLPRFSLNTRLPAVWRAWVGRSLFLTGMLNGLLPCGMVYAALTTALVTASGWQSGLFMAVFGLGTMPALVSIGLFGRALSVSLRAHFRPLQTVLLVAAGALLIWRGLQTDAGHCHAVAPPAVELMCH